MRISERPAISRMLLAGVFAALVVAAAAIYVLSNPGTGSGKPSSVSIDLQIIEDDPVQQIQHFYPGNMTVSLNQSVSLAIRNGDDEPRTFVIKDFNVNVTMGPGTTGRVMFLASKVGAFVFYSPPSVPSPVSQGRPGKYIQGNLIVTQ